MTTQPNLNRTHTTDMGEASNCIKVEKLYQLPYFPDYKLRFFSRHGSGSTYIPVQPICQQIHQHAS